MRNRTTTGGGKWNPAICCALIGGALGIGLSACGGHFDPSEPGDETGAPATVELHGRMFLRRDMWSDAEFRQVLEDARPDRPFSPEAYAAQLRAFTLHHGVFYIEQEPNLALAQRIIEGQPTHETQTEPPSDETGTANTGGIPIATVIGSDNRAIVDAHTSPYSAVAFNNSRGSGFRISPHALLTAAHVVYDTGTNQFFCANESESSNCGSNPGYPKWIFGLNGTSGSSPWLGIDCYDVTVPAAYAAFSATDNGSASAVYSVARYDFAAFGLGSQTCTNTGNTSAYFAVSQTLPSTAYISAGYAEWAKCLNDEFGASQATCTGGTWQLNGQPGQAPYNSAHLWVELNVPNVAAGAQLPAYTVQDKGDVTHGDSGGPLYYINSSGKATVVGTCARNLNSGFGGQDLNIYSRWTSETDQFFFDNTPYPG
jgi:V8-like Glu-specific endopeptidase